MSEEIINCKIVIVGEGQVGKTSIMNSYLGEAFNEEHVMTVSPEHQNKTIMIDNKTIKITFWDTAGQEQFRAVTKMFYKGADIVILVYDVTKPESFDEIKNYWASEVKNNANSLKVLAIFGNKSDLPEKVDEAEVRDYAKSIQAIYGRTSASTGSGINDSINKLVTEFLNYSKKKIEVLSNTDTHESIKIDKKEHSNESNNKSGKKKKWC